MAIWSRKSGGEKQEASEKTLEQMASEAKIKIGRPKEPGYGNGPLESRGMSRAEANQNLIKLARRCGVAYIDEIAYSGEQSIRVTARGYAPISKPTEPKPAA